MNRIERAIRKWAQVMDHPVSEWAIKQWTTELVLHEADEDKILLAMKFQVQANQPPNLDRLKKILENGIPRDWLDRQTLTDDVKSEGARYMRMIHNALNSPDPNGELLKCVQWGKENHPNLEWGTAEREITAKVNRKQPQS
jgi:hypothetical protein